MWFGKIHKLAMIDSLFRTETLSGTVTTAPRDRLPSSPGLSARQKDRLSAVLTVCQRTPSLPSEGKWPGVAGSEGWELKV